MGMGQEWKAGIETTHGKCMIKVIMQYVGWVFRILLLKKSKHFNRAVTYALKYSNRAVKNVL